MDSGTPGAPARVDLHFVETGNLPDAEVAAFAAVLDGGERARADRLPSEARRDFLVAHGLLRLALARACPARPPAQWRFRTGSHGKPEPEDAPGLRISLSHARGLAVAAVSRAGPVGVDGEAIEAVHARPGTAALLCDPAELAAWRRLGPEARTDAFFALWTLKEALLKASGLGLSLDPRSIRCGLAPLRVEAFPVPPGERWRSWTATLGTRFRVSLCLDAHATPAPPRGRPVASVREMVVPAAPRGALLAFEKVPHGP